MIFLGDGLLKKNQKTSTNIRKHHETSRFEDHPRPDGIKKYQKGSENIKLWRRLWFPNNWGSAPNSKGGVTFGKRTFERFQSAETHFRVGETRLPPLKWTHVAFATFETRFATLNRSFIPQMRAGRETFRATKGNAFPSRRNVPIRRCRSEVKFRSPRSSPQSSAPQAKNFEGYHLSAWIRPGARFAPLNR